MTLVILVVEDEREVRDAIVRDLAPFTPPFRVDAAESAEDAEEAVEEVFEAGDELALVLADHLLPGRNGVDLLVELNDRSETAAARKVLITGQAGLEDTVRAVNRAGLDHYVAKPWAASDLAQVVRAQLTDFVEDEIDDVLPYVAVLDGQRLLDSLRGRASDR